MGFRGSGEFQVRGGGLSLCWPPGDPAAPSCSLGDPSPGSVHRRISKMSMRLRRGPGGVGLSSRPHLEFWAPLSFRPLPGLDPW